MRHEGGGFFAVYNDLDELVASARGRPPGWTQGIHGAELWSLFQALHAGPIQCRFLTDCKAVLLGAQRGIPWANDSRRVHGRVWGGVANALECQPEALAWTPAHCTGAQVAGKKLSDGTPMRQRHRIGNAEVDRLAKSSAEADALPFRTRRWIEVKGDRLTTIALWIGRCTVKANHYSVATGGPDGKPLFLRDSEGIATSRLRKYKSGKKRKRKDEVVPRRPGDLSACPRWERVRRRVLDKARPNVS